MSIHAPPEAAPPVSPEPFDADGHTLWVAAHGTRPALDERARLDEMYADYAPGDRTQGLPPHDPDRRERWLDGLLGGLNLLAWDEGAVAGHAALLAGEDGDHELLIFVDGAYQGDGVGSELLAALLSAHRARGGGPVTLDVERTNEAAVGLYRKFGFEVATERAMEFSMRRTV
jgi:ribosomal protein S18 acetylase RimI-like enzyme